MVKRFVVAAVVLAGCSSADFDVAESDAASADTAATVDTDVTTDTATPVPDTGAPPGPDTFVPEVAERDTCVANACGGCGEITAGKPPMTPCGLCNSSKFVCASTSTTKCSVPDDRTESTDVYSSTFDGNGVTISGPTQAAAISFVMKRTGTPTTLKLALQRYDVAPSAAVGDLRVRLIKGTPTTSIEVSNVLSTSFIAATLISTTPMTLTVVLSTTGPIAAGTALWVEVTDRSDLADFAVNGATAAGAPDLDFHYISTAGSYTKLTTIDPYLIVGLKGCF